MRQVLILDKGAIDVGTIKKLEQLGLVVVEKMPEKHVVMFNIEEKKVTPSEEEND